MPDHEVQLELREVERLRQLDRRQQIILALVLIDHSPQPVSAGLGRDGQGPGAARSQSSHQRYANRVGTHRADTDTRAHSPELGCQHVDLRVIGDCGGHEPDPGRLPASRPAVGEDRQALGQRFPCRGQNALHRLFARRTVCVARETETAASPAAPGDLD